VWWASVVWLSITAAIIVWDFIRWFSQSHNPARHEFAIDALVVLFYSYPAAIGVLLACIVPKTGLSTYRRIGGIALLVFCIIAFLTLNFLAFRQT